MGVPASERTGVNRTRIAVMLVAACAFAPTDATSQTYLVVVSGIGGEPRYSKAFHEWSATLTKAARDRYGLPPASIVYLAESAAGAPSLSFQCVLPVQT